MLRKRILILSLAVVILTGLGVIGGTALEIIQPASASVTIEGIGGSSPTFNLIDNPAANTAGGKSGQITGTDTYAINFDNIKFGRNQFVHVGGVNDKIFSIQNNYAKNLIVRFDPPAGQGVVEDPEGPGYSLGVMATNPQYPWWWPGFLGLWVGNHGTLNSWGALLVHPGQSYDCHMIYAPWGNPVPASKQYHINVQLEATNNHPDLVDWVAENMPSNDALFDPEDNKAYYKNGSGEVEILPLDQFNFDALKPVEG